MDTLIDLADKLVAAAGSGEEIEVVAATGTSTSVRAYDGEIEAFTSATSHGLGVRVIADQRQGFASAGTLDVEVAFETLAEARDNAAFAEPDPHVGLAEPDGVVAADIDPWSSEVEAYPDSDRIAAAIDLERRVVAADPRITGVRTASYGDGASTTVLASTNGIRVSGRSSRAGTSVSALASDGDDTTVGYGYDGGLGPHDLDIDAVVHDAVTRATGMLGSAKPASARVTLVLEPRLAANVVGIAAGMLAGDRVLKGRSPFADRLGDQIAASGLTLVDDPTDTRSLAADPHDGEGLATRRNRLVASGVLERFLYDSYSARRAGTVSTGSAVRSSRSTPGVGPQALAVEPGHGAIDDLITDVELGVLVQSMTGLHSGVNPVSGDFSVGIEGHMIRSGAVAEPIREATVASTVPRMLLDIREVAGDLTWLPGGAGMCSLAIDGVALGGN